MNNNRLKYLLEPILLEPIIEAIAIRMASIVLHAPEKGKPSFG
jgi:hypothetical protein